MKYFGDGLSELHKELGKVIRKKEAVEQAKALFLELHAKLSPSEVSGTEENEVDRLLSGLTGEQFAIMPTGKDETIAWVFWHITRIEDLTMNMLVARKDQVFRDEWKNKCNVSLSDTGNALTDDGIMELSKEINIQELLHYHNVVAARTRDIVKTLSPEDMTRRVDPADLNRVLKCGGVTRQEESVWLLDFWGKKDVAGILLMPPTRHVMLHFNDCCKWKESFKTKKGFYRS